jgi:hypothetical protein
LARLDWRCYYLFYLFRIFTWSTSLFSFCHLTLLRINGTYYY